MIVEVKDDGSAHVKRLLIGPDSNVRELLREYLAEQGKPCEYEDTWYQGRDVYMLDLADWLVRTKGFQDFSKEGSWFEAGNGDQTVKSYFDSYDSLKKNQDESA